MHSFLLLALATALYTDQDEVYQLTAEQFTNDVVNGDRLWVIEFMANWCGGCRMVRPWYIESAGKLAKDIPFGALNVDGAGKQFMERYGVSGISMHSQCFFVSRALTG